MKEFYTLSTSVTKIILMILFAGISTLSFGQGVTSANIAGLITDKSGEPLIGATVIAIHTNPLARSMVQLPGRMVDLTYPMYVLVDLTLSPYLM
ncbi:MAG: hypothetical protein IPO25_09575 [Saprospiraceae bacterium]|nr:hypothetical protein [Saprospiraceae bacterium]